MENEKINFKKTVTILAKSTAAIGLTSIAFWVFLKIDIAANAKLIETVKDDLQHCAIKTYKVNFKRYGSFGFLLKFYISPYIYRVYDKNGDFLRTSEWRIWGAMTSGEASPYWIFQSARYINIDNNEDRWTLLQCGKPNPDR